MNDVIQISSKKFLIGCLLVSLALLGIGMNHPFSSTFIATEVLLTILALFIFGSTKYQLDKNALTYGMGFVITATFFTGWWPTSELKMAFDNDGIMAFFHFLRSHVLTLHGLDELIHADTMLFILGLTLFVSVIAQTRLLETVSFAVLKKNKGLVLPTVVFLTAAVSFASGILDGVSMIGLMIRILVIILFLSKTKDDAVIFAVIVSTIITTVCGMWLAYGEPPNLIMKANLHPYLTNSFFLRYCLPVAVGSYFIVYLNLRKRLKGKHVNLQELDIMDLHTADVRFLQASRHGEVLTPIEFVEANIGLMGEHSDAILHRLHKGEPLGEAMINEKLSPQTRLEVLSKFVSDDLAPVLDHHYQNMAHHSVKDASIQKLSAALEEIQKKRTKTQLIGGLSFIPFIALLIAHGINHAIPLFWASFSGFAVAFMGIIAMPKIRKLAIREAKHEYMEYLFLFPLFLSITLLQKAGFFEVMSVLLHQGIEKLGTALVAVIQFTAACFLSALLDNNIVADFASRALHGLELKVLHLFALAQIAGYAVGGCWTHIGSAQSVVAFAFIRREINSRYTPFQWIKAMTPIILEIFVLMLVVIYGIQIIK
jgi:Na+/H+ antiporter NhaD/arsenite permease-like protein